MAVAPVVTAIIASREDAGEMLLEADAGFFRNSGSVGIDSPEKILDFLLNLPVPTLVLLSLMHFRLHPPAISAAATRNVGANPWAMDKFRF